MLIISERVGNNSSPLPEKHPRPTQMVYILVLSDSICVVLYTKNVVYLIKFLSIQLFSDTKMCSHGKKDDPSDDTHMMLEEVLY